MSEKLEQLDGIQLLLNGNYRISGTGNIEYIDVDKSNLQKNLSDIEPYVFVTTVDGKRFNELLLGNNGASLVTAAFELMSSDLTKKFDYSMLEDLSSRLSNVIYSLEGEDNSDSVDQQLISLKNGIDQVNQELSTIKEAINKLFGSYPSAIVEGSTTYYGETLPNTAQVGQLFFSTPTSKG